MVHQWNFNIQQSVGFNTILQAAYVGNRGLRLPGQLFPTSPIPVPVRFSRDGRTRILVKSTA
jgi:hypothetical protein